MQLQVMTFNLRYAYAVPPNLWADRCPVSIECIRRVAPDVMGTQEGLFPMLKDLSASLPEYRYIGTGRDGGSRGEFAAVFYRPDRLEPMEYDHFWLSDTPDVVASRHWGNICVRMVTWVKFRERATGKEFYFWNTHLDHDSQRARDNGAALIAQRVQELNTTLPLFLVGDFNAAGGDNSAYHQLINSGFTDTWYTAQQNLGPDSTTIHDYQGVKPGPRIDWILTRGQVKALETEIVTYNQNGQFPSDHFPLRALVEL